MKESKCVFGMRYVENLGHVVGCGVQTVPEYCSKALQDYQKPQTRKQLRSFISAMSYFRKFIPGFTHFSSVLTPATSRTADRVVRWTEEMDWPFVTLKSKLCNVTDLCIPTCSNVYVMYTDASATGVGAALFA